MPQFEITLTDSGGGLQRVVVEAKDSWSARMEAQRLHPFSEVSAVDSAAPGAVSTPRRGPGGRVPPSGPRLQAVPPRAPTPPPPSDPWKAKVGEVFNLYPTVEDRNAELRHTFKKNTPPLPNQNVAWPTTADINAYNKGMLMPDTGRGLKAVPPPQPPWMDIIPQRAWDDVGRLQELRNDLSGAAFGPDSSRQIRGQITRLENRLGSTEIQDVSNDPVVREYVNRKAGVLQPPAPAPNRLPDLAATSPGRPPLRGFPQDWSGFEATAPGTGPELFQRPPVGPDHPLMRGSMASYPEFGDPSPGVMGMESAPPGSVRPQGPLPGWPFPVPPERFSDGELQSLLRDALPEQRDGVLREISRRQSFARPVGPGSTEAPNVPPNMPVRGLSPAKPQMPNETGAMSGPLSMPEPGLRAPTRPPTPAPEDGMPSWFPRNPPPMSKNEIGVSMMGAGSPRPPTVNARPPQVTPPAQRFARGFTRGSLLGTGAGIAGLGVGAFQLADAFAGGREQRQANRDDASTVDGQWLQDKLGTVGGTALAALLRDPVAAKSAIDAGTTPPPPPEPPPVFARELPQRNVGRPEPAPIAPLPGNEWPQPPVISFDDGSEIVGRPKPKAPPTEAEFNRMMDAIRGARETPPLPAGLGAGPGKAGMALDVARMIPQSTGPIQPEIVPLRRGWGGDRPGMPDIAPIQPEIVPLRGPPGVGNDRDDMPDIRSLRPKRRLSPVGRAAMQTPTFVPRGPGSLYEAAEGSPTGPVSPAMKRMLDAMTMSRWAPDGMY